MKINYDAETDIVMCQLSKKRIDHAEERGPVIVHFDHSDHPVLLEIQGASNFAGELTRLVLKARKGKTRFA